MTKQGLIHSLATTREDDTNSNMETQKVDSHIGHNKAWEHMIRKMMILSTGGI